MTYTGPLLKNRNTAEIAFPVSNDQIRARAFPTCYLCGAVGILLYENLTDRLYGAAGAWTFKQCPNTSCQLIWLDPMPVEEDIGKAYANYYTHPPQRAVSGHSGIERAKAVMTRAYEFGWQFTPVKTERQELEIMYLGGLPPGRVLEIGCGDGKCLAQLRARGWDVQGQEVDESAAAQAQKAFGVPVFCGRLDAAGFSDGEFDAVVMNHVIEHVHDPVALLRGAKRILKPDGHLVSITPNANGWGHKQFGASWRGLEPPRHLLLFSRRTLERIARASGFHDVRTWTTAAHSIWTIGGSLRIQRGEAVRSGWPLITRAIRQAALHIEALLAWRRDRDSGDECVLSARG